MAKTTMAKSSRIMAGGSSTSLRGRCAGSAAGGWSLTTDMALAPHCLQGRPMMPARVCAKASPIGAISGKLPRRCRIGPQPVDHRHLTGQQTQGRRCHALYVPCAFRHEHHQDCEPQRAAGPRPPLAGLRRKAEGRGALYRLAGDPGGRQRRAGAGARRQDVDHRRALYGNQGADGRLHPDRGARHERGGAAGRRHPDRRARHHRGAADLRDSNAAAAAMTQIDLEGIYRAERGRVLASLIRLLGGFELAEEALADAFLAAAQQWPRDGVPAHPRTWLVSAGRFKAVDKLRRSGRFKTIAAEITRQLEDEEAEMPAERETIEDDTLRLIFTCCHPALPLDAQVALTLREVCGLTTEEIAAAFLSKPAAVAQRIVRAKARIRDERLPFEVPAPAEGPQRLDAVLHTIYLIFNEGYDASSGSALLRQELCSEAIRLTRLLKELHPTPDIDGLLALLLLLQSRAPARTGADGSLVLLDDQDRS